MLLTKPAGKEYHDRTKHSYLSVQIDPNYVDPSTQPSPFKFYPKFYRRFPLESDNPAHNFIRLTHTITFNKVYRDGPYQLRVNPSAGALYPTEIYVQISCVYYRSSWKYKDRSFRYCFLDSGHHLGAIEASAYLHDRNSVRKLRFPIPFVCGTDYFEANKFIEEGYKTTALVTSDRRELKTPQFDFDRSRWLEAILNRRSARRFKKNAISQLDFFKILQILQEPIATKSCEDIEIYLIVNRVDGMETGLYQGDRLIRTGDFSDRAGYLCVNQAIARDSAIALFFVSAYQNYQTAVQLAGIIGQRLYLLSEYLGLGCSGIGAYYDDESQEFLDTNKDVIYAMAIGI